MQIEETRYYPIALHHLGFRPFFLLAGVFAIVLAAIWLWVLRYQGSFPLHTNLGFAQWHAHEMIFGYAVATAAGFLLTAVRNWTGVQTLNGLPLLALASLWLLARALPFFGEYLVTAVLDILFHVILVAALFHPIQKTKQWQHLGIWAMVLLLALSNLVFYLGLFGYLLNGINTGLYLGLYTIITLIFLMGRRVIPFFIEKGVDQATSLKNYHWLDISVIVLMCLFVISDLFLQQPALIAVFASLSALLHTIRLIGWYSSGIWSKPLLWILYIGYAWLMAGFVLKALAAIELINPMLAVHSFTVGGIGMITLGMITRVSLGHTGRNVFDPPVILLPMFLLLMLSAIVRIILPLFHIAAYSVLIEISLWLWIVAFTLFVIAYAPMLIKGRVDNRYG